ncbi:Alpha/Beta hydrolase protein [Ilyonectria destructans]|nr:Alpha/Beta hydrolase protein [Ilyonectria destructans]
MTSHPPRTCCIQGHKHEGIPKGSFTEIEGIKCYFSSPPQKSPQRAILFFTDIFGPDLINAQLLADEFALAGYLTIVPDQFENDPAPQRLLEEGFDSFDIMAWLQNHLPDHVDPIAERIIRAVKSDMGVRSIGVVGYCLGAKTVVRCLDGKKGISAGFIAHPAFVEADEMDAVTCPLSIAAAEIDQTFDSAKRHETEVILQRKDIPYQLSCYGNCEHGFAVRTDLKDRQKRFAKESAFFQAVRWFDEWLE